MKERRIRDRKVGDNTFRRKCDLCDANDEIDRLEKLVSENAADIHKLKTQHFYEANGLRALLQNERDNMNAALLEIERLKAECARLREYCRPCDVSAADAGTGHKHIEYGYAFELSHDGTMVLKTIGSGNG